MKFRSISRRRTRRPTGIVSEEFFYVRAQPAGDMNSTRRGPGVLQRLAAVALISHRSDPRCTNGIAAR